MSQNTDHYQLAATPSSLSSAHNHKKRLLTHQYFLPTSADLNASSSVVSSIQNDSSSPQSHTSPLVSDVCINSQNGVRNASTAMKVKDSGSPNGNKSINKYTFNLDLTTPVAKTKKEHNRNSKSQPHPFDMAGNEEQDLHSPFELDVPLCENQSIKKFQNNFLIERMLKDDSSSNFTIQHRPSNQASYTNVPNHASPLLTPSSDHHDIDALSDAGTYIIEDDLDIAHDDEPEQQTEQKEDIEEKPSNPPSSFKRYAKTKRSRHGTFEIHNVSSKINSTVNRPIVDLNVPTHDLSSPSSSSSSSSSSSPSPSVDTSASSSLLSLPTESDNTARKEPEGASHQLVDDKSSTGLIFARQRPTTLLHQQRPNTPPQAQIRPAECFVISPTFETKPLPNTTNNTPRRKPDPQWKPKATTSTVPTKDIAVDISSKKSPPSPPLSARSNLSDTERFSFHLQPQNVRINDSKQQSIASTPKLSLPKSDYVSSSKSSVRPHTIINDPAYSSPFQRNSSIRQTMPANTQYNRQLSASSIATTAVTKYKDENDETLSSHPSLTKVYMNKSFALRRQRSNIAPSASKPVQQQQQQQQQQPVSKPLATKQLLKPTPTMSATVSLSNNSTGQTNRAVELRRARAQAKIEELAQRTRLQLQKTEQHTDIMSASWHSNASSSSKKEFSQFRANPRLTNNNNANLLLQKQDLLKTRTISSSSSHHRSSSASPNPLGETTAVTKPSKYRQGMVTSVISESQYQKLNGSSYSEGERCDSLRDDGQRLAIKLIQLSSGILTKLKPNNTTQDNDSNVRELEQLVDQLQTVNRTLSTIDASLTGPISDENLI